MPPSFLVGRPAAVPVSAGNRIRRGSLEQDTRRPMEFACAVPCPVAALALGAAVAVVLAGSSGAAAAPGDPAPGSPAYLARDAQNIADAYGRQTAPDGQLSPEYGLASAQYINPVFAADLLAQAARPEPPGADPGDGGAGLEQRQPLPRGLGRHPRADDAGLVHQPVRRAPPGRRVRAAARRPSTRTRARRSTGPVPRRGDHDRLGAGQRADVLVAGAGPRRARLRRPDLRRAGAGPQRDVPAPGRRRGPALLRPRRRPARR